MTPHGAQALIDMRMTGQRPSGPVWVMFGDFPEPTWWRYVETRHQPEVVVLPEHPIDRLDLRCVTGLDVILFAAEWSASFANLYERLMGYAAEIAVISPAFEGDIGWWWTKRYGQIAFNDRHWITKFEEAQEACIAASDKGGAAYAAAHAKEMQILEVAPWLH